MTRKRLSNLKIYELQPNNLFNTSTFSGPHFHGYSFIERPPCAYLYIGVRFVSSQRFCLMSLQSTTMTSSLVNHHLAQHGAEKSCATLRNTGSLDVNVPTIQWTYALNIELWAEEGTIKTGDEPAHLSGRVDRFHTCFVVNIDCQTVQVVSVIAIGRDTIVGSCR